MCIDGQGRAIVYICGSQKFPTHAEHNFNKGWLLRVVRLMMARIKEKKGYTGSFLSIKDRHCSLIFFFSLPYLVVILGFLFDGMQLQ